ncbi:MAG: D-glycero-alpha-D-manno-heptose-1,7-bisphosphate 7-phosphatase [Candidatus Saccharimonadales bacterium]
MHHRFVLLDRDGTINVERHYLSDPEQVELLPNAARGLASMSELGLGLIVVTNQSGVGRGLFDATRLDEIHARLRELLAAEGVRLDGIFYCPHLPEQGCRCRKPLAGLVENAAREFGFRPEECFVVGDKPCDLELGRAIGATTFLVRTGYGSGVAVEIAAQADYVVEDLWQAAQAIDHLLGA